MNSVLHEKLVMLQMACTVSLKKLDHYGVRGIPLQWFWSYLSGRKHYVSVAGNLSEALEISYGVP